MIRRRDDNSVNQDTYTSAINYYSEIRKGMREKANHNKCEAQYIFYSIICFTLLAPIFVTLGEGWLFGKLVPATLSVCAAAASAWLQLRKPQRLWAIYRRAQRELEREKASYDFNLNQYHDAADKDRILAERVSEIAFGVHEQWEGLVPEPENLVSLTASVTPKQSDEKNAV